MLSRAKPERGELDVKVDDLAARGVVRVDCRAATAGLVLLMLDFVSVLVFAIRRASTDVVASGLDAIEGTRDALLAVPAAIVLFVSPAVPDVLLTFSIGIIEVRDRSDSGIDDETTGGRFAATDVTSGRVGGLFMVFPAEARVEATVGFVALEVAMVAGLFAGPVVSGLFGAGTDLIVEFLGSVVASSVGVDVSAIVSVSSSFSISSGCRNVSSGVEAISYTNLILRNLIKLKLKVMSTGVLGSIGI